MLADGKVIEEGNCYNSRELVNSILKIIRTVNFSVTSVSVKIGNGVPVYKELLQDLDDALPAEVVLEVVGEAGTNRPLTAHSRKIRHISSAIRIAGRTGRVLARKAERAAQLRAAEGANDRTFKALAERYIARHEATWKNDKHRAQWKSTLIAYAYPSIGALDVAAIGRGAVLDVLEPIWTRAPETASRLRGRIETVLDYAAAKGWRTEANPARWRDLRHDLPAPKKVKPVANQPALPWQQMPGFMADLRKREATAARALEFVILTAARTTEVLGAVWREVDLAEATWTIPARRMKAARPHRVALSPAAVAVLEGMKPLGTKPDSFIFPGQRPGSRLSGMALLMLLRRMQKVVEQALKDEPPRPRWADAEGRAITAAWLSRVFPHLDRRPDQLRPRDRRGRAGAHDQGQSRSGLSTLGPSRPPATADGGLGRPCGWQEWR